MAYRKSPMSDYRIDWKKFIPPNTRPHKVHELVRAASERCDRSKEGLVLQLFANAKFVSRLVDSDKATAWAPRFHRKLINMVLNDAGRLAELEIMRRARRMAIRPDEIHADWRRVWQKTLNRLAIWNMARRE